VTPTNSCLDGETLAAWVDGGLSRSDAAMAEAHVSSCPRCQEITGLVVKTTPMTPVAVPWWRARAAWLVPATVGVAAVGLWIIAPTSPAPSPVRPPAPSERQRVEGPATIAPLESARDAAVPAAPPVAPPAAAPEPVPQQAGRRQDLKREKEAADRVQARANTAATAPAPPAAVAAPTEAAPPAAASARPAAEQGARQESAKGGAKDAVSPDGALHWRITDRGALERSTDRGTTWQAVNVGITATFTTVQAPQARTAIVTTTDGRQFRTTDGGATWSLVPKMQDF
jgi:hypothetical protein